MKGIELAEKFYNEYGSAMLDEFREIMPFIAAGITGSGSECYGYDDDISADHDFEPGFCIFIPDESIIDSRTEFRLERAYAKLPKEFEGYKRSNLSPVGGNRHGVFRISEFFESKLGSADGRLSLSQWFSVPSYALAEAVNGKIFFDNYGKLTSVRNSLTDMPEDVRLKKLAGNILLMGQAGQYNYERCIARNETGAAQMSIYEFVKSAMNVIFLLNKAHMPYYKWSFRALRGLEKLSENGDRLEYLISSDNTPENVKAKTDTINKIVESISAECENQQITEKAFTVCEEAAYSINSKIKNNDIRNLHILYAV